MNVSTGNLKVELDNAMRDFEGEVINQLAYVGEQAINTARDLRTYKDRTGNLRSSIGYVVFKDGKPVKRGSSGNKQEASAARTALLDSLQGKFPKGFALIVVAGMNYASYVEDIHHLPVLQPSKDLAADLVKQLFAK